MRCFVFIALVSKETGNPTYKFDEGIKKTAENTAPLCTGTEGSATPTNPIEVSKFCR